MKSSQYSLLHYLRRDCTFFVVTRLQPNPCFNVHFFSLKIKLILIVVVSQVGVIKELELVLDDGGLPPQLFGLRGHVLQLLERPLDVAHVVAHVVRRLVHQMTQTGKRRRQFLRK